MDVSIQQFGNSHCTARLIRFFILGSMHWVVLGSLIHTWQGPFSVQAVSNLDVRTGMNPISSCRTIEILNAFASLYLVQ